MEWTDPRYTELVEAMRRAQLRAAESGSGHSVRGFVVAPDGRRDDQR
ncbi:hypothetical protein J7W19_28375 [Streptomyces mobaraensis NBRC 13819 = DSM 40847]|nr:hypothetical protein [Streptomyces mobaraensis]QTT76770.1 hypothetical protein J7W19_28375 [Streptomyces mobaraensis NBRC 13819 = DSM 40847]